MAAAKDRKKKYKGYDKLVFNVVSDSTGTAMCIWGDDIGNSVGNRTWVVGDKYGILCFSK